MRHRYVWLRRWHMLWINLHRHYNRHDSALWLRRSRRYGWRPLICLTTAEHGSIFVGYMLMALEFVMCGRRKELGLGVRCYMVRAYWRMQGAR